MAHKFFHPPIEALPSQFTNRDMWKSVWCLGVPSKVKVFVWKLIHEGVPVRKNLKTHIASVVDSCPWCFNSVELVHHCFLAYPHSKQVWERSNLVRLSRNQESIPCWQWWVDTVMEMKKDMHGSRKLVEISFILWRIWLARNGKVFEDKDTDPQVIASTTSSLAEEYIRLSLNIS